MAGISKILIDQQLAEVGVNVTPAKMHITTPRPKITISQENAQMEIDRKAPTFKLNRKKMYSQMRLRTTPELSTDFRNKGKAAAARGAGSRTQDGNFLGNVRNQGDRVAQLAHNKAMARIRQKSQMNIEAIPKEMPEITWDKGHVRVNWSRHSLVIDFDGEFLPQLTVDPNYSVEVYLRTKPYFRITVAEGVDPYMPGRHIDHVL
jgi:hypothetical protein